MMTNRLEKSSATALLRQADAMRETVGGERFRDELVEILYRRASEVAARVVRRTRSGSSPIDDRIDRILTHPLLGLPVMTMLLAVIFWLTVVGANIPSSFLASLLMTDGGLSSWFQEYFGISIPAMLSISLYQLLHIAFEIVRAPSWLSGFFVDGVYLGLAWVVSVMLPPMAIFFPLFTLLEDLGYLPRVAFNLDWLFKRAGAHGKQALTMAMGFGCNAAGVVACRIIDSPREKLIAILTNTFVPCNGRFPTLVTVASLFVAGAAAKPGTFVASLIGTGTVVGVVVLGVVTTLVVSWVLSQTVLCGQPSAFVLELPPYRRPSVGRVIYTSLIDRTIFVLYRACIVAAPAGGIIWIMGNWDLGGASIAHHVSGFLDPFGRLLGMDGVILLAFIIAIPANEIVMPTALMLYMNQSRMVQLEGPVLSAVLTSHGWTVLTAVSLMLFSLMHNPCGTTIWTIWSETKSIRWTVFGALMPLTIAILVCALVAILVRVLGAAATGAGI
jgi:ferrous iron transport protein B